MSKHKQKQKQKQKQRQRKKAKASQTRDGGVEDQEIKEHRSVPQLSSPTQHSPPHPSPLRRGVTYGKDMFSESENDADAGHTDGRVTNDGNNGDDEIGDSKRQQAISTGSVAGPSTRQPKISPSTYAKKSPLDEIIDIAVQQIRKQPLPSPAVTRIRAEEAEFLQAVSPPPTPQTEEPSDNELRAYVEEFLSLLSPTGEVGQVPLGCQLFAMPPPPTSPPVGTFRPPRDWSHVPTPSQKLKDTEPTANLPPMGLFSPTGKTLQAYRESLSSAATSGERSDEQAASSESAPLLPPMGTFTPTGQALQALRQSQQQSKATLPEQGDEHSRETATATASFHPPIPHIPTEHEDTTKLDILAAAALGQLGPDLFVPPDTAFPSLTSPDPASGSSVISSPLATVQSTIAKDPEPHTLTSNNMAPPPPATSPTAESSPPRRRAPPRQAALRAQELSRKMATIKKLEEFFREFSEDANADATTNNNNTTTVQTGSGLDDGGNNIDPATGQPYTGIDMGDHVFRDIPHKDSSFPHPKARELKKAIAAGAGDPHDPEFVKRHTERYQKRLESNTSQWPDSNLRAAEDTEAHRDRTMKNKMAQMIRDFKDMETLEEKAEKRKAKRLAKKKEKEGKGKGKHRASSSPSSSSGSVTEDDEAATIVDSMLTITDSNMTVPDERARANAERNRLVREAILVWQSNEEIRNHYNKLDREQSDRNLRKVNEQFNSRLRRAVDGGSVSGNAASTTPPPKAPQSQSSSTVGITRRNKSSKPSAAAASSSGAQTQGQGQDRFSSHQQAMETIFTRLVSAVATAQKQKDQAFPTPETSFNIGEGSFSQPHFDFRVPNPCPGAATQKEDELPKGDGGMGLDGASDVLPKNTTEKKPFDDHDLFNLALHHQQPDGNNDVAGKKIVYEEVDFEIDNPVPPLQPAATRNPTNSNSSAGPVNMTSKIGDEPFSYDPRFDPTEVYPGILKQRYRHHRRLVQGGAEARKKIEAAKKREEEDEERKRREREEEIRNDPLEALLREYMGDAYVGPSGSASGSGAAESSASFLSLPEKDDRPERH